MSSGREQKKTGTNLTDDLNVSMASSTLDMHNTVALPLKARWKSDFYAAKNSEASKTSFHTVTQVCKYKRPVVTHAEEPKISMSPTFSTVLEQLSEDYKPNGSQTPKVKTRPKPSHIHFFKANPPGSPMSELEAYASACYHFIIPKYAPTAHAVFDIDKGSCEPIAITSKGFDDFKTMKDTPLTADDLKKESIIQSLAEILVASYYFEEDDLHPGNLGIRKMKLADGREIAVVVRIDFDNSFWQLFYSFKQSTFPLLDWLFRHPEGKFKLDEKDIREFPDITVAAPYYWPTKISSPKISASSNQFSQKDIDLYKSVKSNSLFNYHKYKAFLKILITDVDIFKTLAILNIRDKFGYQGKNYSNFHHVLFKHLEQRKKKLFDIMSTMPEFSEFLTDHGEKAMQEIENDFREHNDKIERKVAKKNLGDTPRETFRAYKALTIDIDACKQRYQSIVAACRVNIVDPPKGYF